MTPKRWQARRYFICCLIIWTPLLIGSLWWADRHAPAPGIAAAWAVNLVNSLGVAIINRFSFSHSANRFLAWALLGNGARLGIMVVATLIFHRFMPAQTTPYLITLLTGYFLSLFVEIYFLQSLSLAADQDSRSTADTAQAE